MNTEISTWGGYAVHGDVKELDRIVESTGLINLDKEDIIKVLSSDGEIFVTYGAKRSRRHSTDCLARVSKSTSY